VAGEIRVKLYSRGVGGYFSTNALYGGEKPPRKEDVLPRIMISLSGYGLTLWLKV
jgi:hypothetical protein